MRGKWFELKIELSPLSLSYMFSLGNNYLIYAQDYHISYLELNKNDSPFFLLVLTNLEEQQGKRFLAWSNDSGIG